MKTKVLNWLTILRRSAPLSKPSDPPQPQGPSGVYSHAKALDAGYRSDNVGNDATAHPWEQIGRDFVPTTLRARDHAPQDHKQAHAEEDVFVLPDVPSQANSGLLSKKPTSTSH